MRIAILTPTFYEYSGIDRVAESQAIEYSKKGDKVTIFTFDSKIKPKDYKLVNIGMPKNLFLQRLYRLLFFLDRKKIKKYSRLLKDYDLVISHMYPMNLIAKRAKQKYGIKYRFHNHGVGFPSLFKNPIEKLYMKLFIMLNNISLNNVDEAISISKFMQSELKRESGIDSKVVYNKIDPRRFNKRISSKEIIIRHKLKDKKVLLFVGRLSPHKNVHALLKAFKIINKRNPDTKLIIIGKPTFDRYYEKLKKMSNKDVIFLKSVDDKNLPKYYNAADVYVTASLWEGFNLPAAEAQAVGKPIVAFNCCSHPEIIKKGILVKPNEINKFAEAVIKLLK